MPQAPVNACSGEEAPGIIGIYTAWRFADVVCSPPQMLMRRLRNFLIEASIGIHILETRNRVLDVSIRI
jgi:hypothetical protein